MVEVRDRTAVRIHGYRIGVGWDEPNEPNEPTGHI
jgi:hypothetical protein